MSGTPPISPFQPNTTQSAEGSNTSSKPRRKTGFFGLQHEKEQSQQSNGHTQASTNGNSRRRTEKAWGNAFNSSSGPSGHDPRSHISSSSSGPSNPQATENGNPRRRTESTWGDAFRSSSGPNGRDPRSHISSSSSGPSNPRAPEERSLLRNLRNGRSPFSPSRESDGLSSSSPFDASSGPLDPQRRQFVLDMQELGFDLSKVDLSRYTLDELDTFRSRALEISHQGAIEETETPVGTPSLPTTELEKFQMLYTAVARAVNPDLPVTLPQEVPPTFTYTDSTNDQGGHGGTKKVTLEYHGQTYDLFLKPKDRAEVLGYELTAFFDQRRKESAPEEDVPQVSRYMAKTYGIIRIDNREYFVMQDFTANGNDPIMDVKPAYCIEDLDNPIASREEIEHTGRTKPFLDYFQMKLGAHLSGGYMIAHPKKIKRFVNYGRSQNVFKNNLRKHYTLDQIQQMRDQLKMLQVNIASGEITYIGSSFLFLRNGLYFIDPAHPQVDPAEEIKPDFILQFRERFSHIYFGAKQENYSAKRQEFLMRRASTIFSINLMLQHMEEVLGEKQTAKDDGFPLDIDFQDTPVKVERRAKLYRENEPKPREEPTPSEIDAVMQQNEADDLPLNTGTPPKRPRR